TGLDDVHVAAVGAGRAGGRDAPGRRRADTAEHRGVRNRDLVAPEYLAVTDGADVGAVRAIVAQPFAQLFGVGRARAALANRRANVLDGDCERVARLSPLHPDRAGQRVAERDPGLVAAVGVGADLARQSILGLDKQGFARLDAQARLI